MNICNILLQTVAFISPQRPPRLRGMSPKSGLIISTEKKKKMALKKREFTPESGKVDTYDVQMGQDILECLTYNITRVYV